MKIITIKELSALLKVKEKTLYQWAELGQIPSIKINGALRFDTEDIQEWVNDCKKEAENSYNSLTQARGPRKGGK
jgi:excisionase family DNA binding protein